MFLYGLTLQRASQITVAAHGNFSGTKQQLIVVGRGKVLELLRPDATTGKLHTMLSVEIFGVIRCLLAFRLTGGTKDFLAVTSDSGRVVILEYKPEKNTFETLHKETYGKSGCRRIVPGEYLAVDPKGRAIMLGAVEKHKLVYILNRDASARLTISSPLEAHKARTLVFSIIGLDVGFENPMFACLEFDYEDVDNDNDDNDHDIDTQSLQQNLTFYELDLALNHVVRKQSEPLDSHANLLIPVPGGADGPGGVLVCFDGFIEYRNFMENIQLKINIPKRHGDLSLNNGSLITCIATHKTKNLFFFLLQTEYGDLFKLTLTTEKQTVIEIKLKYFDTVPVAVSLSLLKNGLLFVASEFGNHHLYQIQQIGDNEDEPEFSTAFDNTLFVFSPRELRNLVLVDESNSLAPITACQIIDLLDEDTPQFYATCGRGSKSSFRMLKHGLEVNEMAVTELPGNASAIWTVKKHISDVHDSYIIVSFLDATLVLSIGETVEEVTDSGFSQRTRTLSASSLGDDSFLQIHSEGVRHIFADKRVSEWRPPSKRYITQCAVNNRQVVIAMGSEIVYFELDRHGQLNEYTERKEMPAEVRSIGLCSISSGTHRSRFVCIGLEDATVRIMSLDENTCLELKSTQALPMKATSLNVLEMGGMEGESTTMYLSIGLENGVLVRSVIDKVTGELSDSRNRYLGSRGVKLVSVLVQGQEAVVALTSRAWLYYSMQGHARMTPLAYESLDFAASFSTEQCPEGIVAIARNTLRVLSFDRLGAVFKQTSIPLKFTPRKFCIDKNTHLAFVIEGDHGVRQDAFVTKEEGQQQQLQEGKESEKLITDLTKLDVNQHQISFGHELLKQGNWASNIRIIDPVKNATVSIVPLEQNEFAVSISIGKFISSIDNVTYLAVGTVKDYVLNPKSFSKAFIKIYKIIGDNVLNLVHETSVEDIPSALLFYQGKLLAGIGRLLRLYDLGKKKLLRKCETRAIPNAVVDLQTMGKRVFAADVQESVFFIKYKPHENVLSLYADDPCPRWVTCMTLLDFNTIAIADKFGNISLMRLPDDTNDDIEEDPTGLKNMWSHSANGASQKATPLAYYHVGETCMSIQKTVLNPGGSEAIVYTTLAGGVGVLVPFTIREDMVFFQTLEMHMRAENPPLCGRDHLAFRSSYWPQKGVIDGDLCEQFYSLEVAKKKMIAQELGKTPAEVAKKLEDLRNKYAF